MMLDQVTDQNLVLHTDEAQVFNVYHAGSENRERILHLRIKPEDAAILDAMWSRNGCTSVNVGIALTELSPLGDFVNQLHANQDDIPDKPNPAPKRFHKPKEKSGQYSEEARELHIHSFFRTPKVWQEIASDSHYQEWCRKQKCAYTKAWGTDNDPIQAAHVRRVEDGAGTSIKNEYATIPLLASVHRKQHNNGEGSVGGREWYDKARIWHVTKWGWETLKERLGYAHWYNVPPIELCVWAQSHDVFDELPVVYKNAMELKELTEEMETA